MNTEIPIEPTKPPLGLRNWRTFKGQLGQVVQKGRFFFAWKNGCFVGTFCTFDHATESLAMREFRKID
jgi:hypothetical protein